MFTGQGTQLVWQLNRLLERLWTLGFSPELLAAALLTARTVQVANAAPHMVLDPISGCCDSYRCQRTLSHTQKLLLGSKNVFTEYLQKHAMNIICNK